MFAAMLQKLGIADEVNKKAVLGKGGYDVAASIAEGRAELGVNPIEAGRDNHAYIGGRCAPRHQQGRHRYHGQ